MSSTSLHCLTNSDKKRFACTQCSMSFTQSGHVKGHLRTHTGEKPFSCTQCSELFTHSSNLKAHLRTHTGEKPFACTQCSKRFTVSASLKIHLRTHTGEKPFAYKQCIMRFTESGKLERHVRTHTGEKPFTCTECSQRFTVSYSFKRHLLTHTGKKPFACTQCSMRFTQASSLKTHLNSHSGEKLFVSILFHLSSHTAHNKCESTECSMSLNQLGSLESYVIHNETCRENSLLSPDKKKQFNVITGFNIDERSPVFREFSDLTSSVNSSVFVVPIDKSFACSQCSKRFTLSNPLKRHLMTHTGEKLFACTQCSMRFTESGHLKNHLRTHTGETPFACTQCSMRFTRASSLETHLKSQSCYLTRHLSTHSGEKPFVSTLFHLSSLATQNNCESAECSMSLNQLDSLESHVNDNETGRENLLFSPDINSQINVNIGFNDDGRSPDVSSSADSSVCVASIDYKDKFNYETDCMQAMRKAYQLIFVSAQISEKYHASFPSHSGGSVEAPAPVGSDKCSVTSMSIGSSSSSAQCSVMNELRDQDEYISKRAKADECDLILDNKPEYNELCNQENADEDCEDYKD